MKIVHADFIKRMAGVQMYIKSIAAMQIQDLAAWVYAAKAEIPYSAGKEQQK